MLNGRRCTRCLGVRDREPVTFVEQFSDSAWCDQCLDEYNLGQQAVVAAIAEHDEPTATQVTRAHRAAP